MDREPPEAVARDAARVSRAVVEDAIALVRAEMRLGLARGRALAVGAAACGVGMFVAICFGQVALILLALAPPIGHAAPSGSWIVLGIALGVAFALALAGVIAAGLGIRSLRKGIGAHDDDGGDR